MKMSLPVCTVNTNNIQNLSDSPALAPNELKQTFDKSSKDLKDYLNEILLPAVEKLVRDEKANLEIAINNKILADNKKKYHVGKIIMSTDNTNPSEYLGFGTWVLWGNGKVPVGVDTNDTDFNTVEKTGGEKKHKLTIKEMPKHRFGVGSRGSTSGAALAAAGNAIGMEFLGDRVYSQYFTEYLGSNEEHNNVQPYITCYMWKRTV